MATTEDSYYFIDLYCDVGNENTCYATRYRFETEEISLKFTDHVSKIENLTISDNGFETFKILGYSVKYPNRPRFTELHAAIDDLNEFIQYSNHKTTCYKYRACVDEKTYSSFTVSKLYQDIEGLKNENDTLRKENETLKEYIKDNFIKLTNKLDQLEKAIHK